MRVNQITEYNRALDMAKDLKVAIESYEKKIPITDSDSFLTWDGLKAYVGKTFDVVGNRRIAMQGSGFVATIGNNLGQKRERTLRQALKEYNPELYGEL